MALSATAAAQTKSTHTRTEHASRARSLGDQFPTPGKGLSVEAFHKLPKAAFDVVEVLSKLDNSIEQELRRLELPGGSSEHAPALSTKQALAALATIEKRANKKASTILAEAAKRVDSTSAEALLLGAKLLRSGLDKHDGFRSMIALEKMSSPKPPPPASEAQQKIWKSQSEAYEARVKQEEYARRAGHGYDSNWQDGNRPSQLPPLFVR